MTTTLTSFPPVAELRLRVLRAAGGDARQAEVFHAMMWDAYCDADRPFGPDETGMWTWWAFGQGSTGQ